MNKDQAKALLEDIIDLDEISIIKEEIMIKGLIDWEAIKREQL